MPPPRSFSGQKCWLPNCRRRILTLQNKWERWNDSVG
jgi:hypothetical protein